MNRNIILIALLALLSVGKAAAQSVTVEAKIDSLQILIGEQAKVQLQVAMDAKQRAIFPAYTDTLVRGVEIIETVKPDTQFLNDRQRMLITQEYIITSFDSALYYLPPMPVTSTSSSVVYCLFYWQQSGRTMGKNWLCLSGCHS